MKVLIESSDKCRFTRLLPVQLKCRWKLGDRFQLPINCGEHSPNCENKKVFKLNVVPTAVYSNIIEYIYRHPFTKENVFGLISADDFISKATK